MLALPQPFSASSFHKTESSIGVLPTEIWFIILDCLPAVDQVCCALTCKSLYAFFLASLKTKPLEQRLPKLLIPKQDRTILCRNLDLEKRDRTQLLRRLETPRWKCCIECLNIHPHSAWEQPTCESYECQILVGVPCMPYAGLVDICPCQSITFRDRGRIVQDIRSTYNLHTGSPQYPQFGGFYTPITSGIGYHKLYHQCEVISHRAKVEIETILEATPDLGVSNIYKFHFNEPMDNGKAGSLICPQFNPREWLGWFFRDAGVEFVGWDKDKYSCFAAGETGRSFFEIRAYRYLGCRGWPDKAWESKRNDHGRML